MPSLYKEGDRRFAMLSGLVQGCSQPVSESSPKSQAFPLDWPTCCTLLSALLGPLGAGVHVTMECWWHKATSSCVWRKWISEKKLPFRVSSTALPNHKSTYFVWINNAFYVVCSQDKFLKHCKISSWTLEISKLIFPKLEHYHLQKSISRSTHGLLLLQSPA